MANSSLAAAEFGLLCALIVSVVRFAWVTVSTSEGFEHPALAVGSSLVSLAVVSMLYSGQFERICLAAIGHWTSDEQVLTDARRALSDADRALTDLANFFSPGPHLASRPHPTLTPLAIIAALYLIRLSIYFAVTRRRIRYADPGLLKHAAVTGPVYWSHITAYAMVLSFFIVIARSNPVWVSLTSIGVIVVLVVGFTGPFQDGIVLCRDAVRSSWHLATSLGGTIARASLVVARAVRLVVERAHQFYMRRISDPLRRVSGRAVAATERLEQRTKEQLREEAQKHARFARDDGVRADAASAPEAPPAPEV